MLSSLSTSSILVFVGLVLCQDASVEANRCADVIGASARQAVDGTWTFDVTVSSPYETGTGWDKYADAWQVHSVVSSDKNVEARGAVVVGTLLGTRPLAHPHVNEQPFTRSLSGVVVDDTIDTVVFSARDLVDGYCGERFILEIRASLVVCFSGASTLQLKNVEEPVPISHIQLGDEIHVGEGDYEPVYSFGHYSPLAMGEFLRIEASSESFSTIVEISPNHMFLTLDSGAVPASMIHVGSKLLLGRGDQNRSRATVVTAISTTTQQGLFAPFTPSGKLVVNGIMASSYVAMIPPDSLLFMINQQWLAHAFQFPHRLVCHYSHLSDCMIEQYTDEGLSTWVAAPFHCARRVQQLHPFVSAGLLLVLLPILAFFQLLEAALIAILRMPDLLGFSGVVSSSYTLA